LSKRIYYSVVLVLRWCS